MADENADERKVLEDEVRTAIDDWSRPKQAIAYFYLWASGWRIDEARRVKRELGET